MKRNRIYVCKCWNAPYHRHELYLALKFQIYFETFRCRQRNVTMRLQLYSKSGSQYNNIIEFLRFGRIPFSSCDLLRKKIIIWINKKLDFVTYVMGTINLLRYQTRITLVLRCIYRYSVENKLKHAVDVGNIISKTPVIIKRIVWFDRRTL